MFTFEPGVGIWSVLSFLLVFFFLQHFVYPPMRKILDERRKTIEFSLEESQKNRIEAKKLFDQAEDQLKGVRQDAQQILSDAQRRGKELENEHQARAMEEYRTIRNEKQKELAQMEKDFLDSVENHVAALVLQACQKILSVDLTPDQKEQIIQKRIKELENLKAI